MNKINIQKYKHHIIIGAIILIAILILSWIGYSDLDEASDSTTRIIINDEFSELTLPLDGITSIKQDIVIEAQTKLYGASFNFHTYSKVVSGEITLDLLDENGNVILTQSEDMNNIKDNTFMGFIFDDYVVSEDDTKYTLHLYTTPQTENDIVALWKSEENKDGFQLSEGINAENGTLVLQVITNFSGHFIYSYYIIFSLAILIILMLAYYLIFIKKMKIEYLFLVFAIYIGVMFSFLTPIRGGADEYVHIANSYMHSSNILGLEALDEQGDLLVRKSDEYDLSNPINYNVFDLQMIYDGLSLSGSGNDELVPVKARFTEAFNVLYIPQTVGITIARILNLGFVPMMVFSRVLNLLAYAGLCFLAIKKIPFYKSTLALIALTPIPLQTAASFSYDTLIIGASFWFIAFCFNLIYEKDKVERKDIILLVLFSLFISQSKAVYVMLIGLSLLIPNIKFKEKKEALIAKSAVVLVGLFFWIFANSSLISVHASDIVGASGTTGVNNVSAETIFEEANTNTNIKNMSNNQLEIIDVSTGEEAILANGDSSVYYSFSYILKNIPATIRLVANTIGEKTELYIYEMFGGKLGEVIITPISINWIYIIAVIIILLLSTIQKDGFEIKFKGFNKLASLIIILGVSGMIVLACITWTPSNYETIFGIQGRYFIPILPLVFFSITFGNIRVKKSMDGLLMFSLVAVNMLILLNAFSIMALR